MFRMLTREDMVEGCQLVEVGIARLGITAMQLLRQFQHIVGVTGFRTVYIADEILAGFLTWKVLATAVATKGQCALTCYDVPEIGACCVISLIA